MHKPTNETRQTVRDLSSVKCSHVQIGAKLGITDNTLREHYRKELDEGMMDLIRCAGVTISNAAKRGDTDAAKFVLSRIGNCAPAPRLVIATEDTSRIAETAKELIEKKEEAVDY